MGNHRSIFKNFQFWNDIKLIEVLYKELSYILYTDSSIIYILQHLPYLYLHIFWNILEYIEDIIPLYLKYLNGHFPKCKNVLYINTVQLPKLEYLCSTIF